MLPIRRIRKKPQVMASTEAHPMRRAVLAAVGSFLLGTVVVPVYERLAYDGFSISQPYNVLTTNFEDAIQVASYGTVLKIANSTKSSIIIDSVRSADLHFDSKTLKFIGTRIKASNKGITVPIPITIGGPEDADSGFPILVKPDAVASLQIELMYRPLGGTIKDVQHEFSTLYRDKGILIDVQVNGKFRSYTLLTRMPDEYQTSTP